MRVIAGLYRSRRLLAPPGTSTRPTSDRLRETLFNILAPRFEAASAQAGQSASARGIHFVDLFAGTGAVGIEALSRGAVHVSFAERATPALRTLRANLAALDITSGYSINESGTLPLLRTLTSPADIVFLDPPYNSPTDYTDTLTYLATHASTLLTPTSLVIAEHASRTPLPERFSTLTQTRTLKQGDAALTFYSLA